MSAERLLTVRACTKAINKYIHFHIMNGATQRRILTERRNLFVPGAAWSDSSFSRALQQVAAQ